jgi:hypothetical protein
MNVKLKMLNSLPHLRMLFVQEECFTLHYIHLHEPQNFKYSPSRTSVLSSWSPVSLGVQFIVCLSVLRRVYSLFESEFSTECDPVLPPSISTIFPFYTY